MLFITQHKLILSPKLNLIRRLAGIVIVLMFFGDRPFGITTLETKVLSQQLDLTWRGDLAVTQAQIEPDNTLGNENSQVIPDQNINGLPADLIEGGATRGQNLFHSFSQFNIESGQGAYFANPEGIANIFSRVTGNDVSDILGTLGVNGIADLFLINPNGIIFGENASLDLNGSFSATTADAIQFSDRGFFSAANPDEPPLLTVRPSAFFFNETNSGTIENISFAPTTAVDIFERSLFGLVVPNGESLLLVGGEIAVDGGELNALDGRIELLSIADQGTVELDTAQDNPSLEFPTQLQLADISISNDAFINTSNEGGGAINLQGKNISIGGESRVFANTLGDLDGNGIAINVDQSLSIANSSILAATVGQGDSGDININANSFSVLEGSQLNTSVVFSALANNFRQAGNINITAQEVTFDGGFAFSRLERGTTGRGGDINITTDSLLVTGIPPELVENNIGQLVTATFGEGDAGNLTIDATGDVVFDGLRSDVFTLVAGDFVNLRPLAIGDGGDITINSDSLTVKNQSRLVSRTEGEGNAGDISINTNSLTIANGSQLLSEVDGLAIGDAGDIEIKTQSLDISARGQINARTAGNGNAGNIDIVASDRITLTGIEGEEDTEVQTAITNQLLGSANVAAGTITISNGDFSTAPRLEISNGANITAIAGVGEDAGNINLIDLETLLLRNNSFISTTAGIEGTGGDGGNITIDTDFLITFPEENNDIIANAFEGRGGSIQINAFGIFGLETSTQLTSSNDITAFSQQNPQLDGMVDITTTEVNQDLGLLQLPIDPISAQVVPACGKGGSAQQSKFIIRGRGGLPDSPQVNLSSDFGLEDWRVLGQQDISDSVTDEKLSSTNPETTEQIVEANRWILDSQGKIILVADNSADKSNSLTQQSPKNCQTN